MHKRTRRTFSVAAAAALAATALTATASPAVAAPYCDASAKAGFARAQLFADPNCKGGSMIIRSTESNGDRPNFARFRNYDGKTYNIDNSRSSVAVAAGNCIRVFDGANYTGAESNLLCAGAGTVYYGLFAFDNRASSLRICTLARKDHCARDGGVTSPTPPPPTPPPTPPPGPNGFPPDLKVAFDKARYDDAASWSGGKNCSHGFTAGAKRMQAGIRANYGKATIQGYNCRPNTADRSKTSIHGVGRASDWFRNAGNPTHAAQVANFIARMSANGAAMARAMGVQYWIWNRKQYSVRGTAVVVRNYGGPNPHTDHVHLEQNLPGSKLQTTYWRLAGG